VTDCAFQGILQGLSPFLLHFIGTYPQYRMHMMWVGMVLVVASSLGAAFSTTVGTMQATASHSQTDARKGRAGHHDTRPHVRYFQRDPLRALHQLRR
jgi:hypothetical protein